MNEEQSKEITNAYLRLPSDLHAEAKQAAKERGISLNQLVVNILEEHMRKVPVPLNVVERGGTIVYEINVPPDYFINWLEDVMDD